MASFKPNQLPGEHERTIVNIQSTVTNKSHAEFYAQVQYMNV